MSNDFNVGKGKYWQRSLQLVDGCTPVSAGCDNCWSAAIAHRFKQGLTNKDKFNGTIKLREDNLDLPLRTKKPKVFAIWNDLFHKEVPLNFIYDVYNRMYHCPQHIFLILTKRIEVLENIWPIHHENQKYHSHIWHGVSIENQQTADKRIPHLLQIPGKKFLSIEPMLGPINISGWLTACDLTTPLIDQVILGGETGRNARPCHPDWVRSIRNQCQDAGIPFFLKHIDKNHGRVLDGRTHDSLVWRQNG